MSEQDEEFTLSSDFDISNMSLTNYRYSDNDEAEAEVSIIDLVVFPLLVAFLWHGSLIVPPNI